jgi:hypothetical protein
LAQNETPENVVINNRSALHNGDSAWYNHSEFRPVGFHFCSAIAAGNLKKINGFDERFNDGIAYEDNYFVHQIKSLGLNIKIINYPFVFHQFHYSNTVEDITELVEKNRLLYLELSQGNDYKAHHILTQSL